MSALRGVILLGKLTTPALLGNVDILPEGLEVYDRGLRLDPGAPVLVDHDKTRPIGRVVDLAPFDDWLAARVLIDSAPGWLRKGSSASVCYTPLQRMSLGAATRVVDGLVTEVSVLSPRLKPANAGAKVALLYPDSVHSPPMGEAARSRSSATEYALQPGDRVIHHAGGGQLLIRPNCGEILAVY